ncbi:MAG: 4Fe-4S ferredoxin [Thiohalocapsa sp.]|uniref:4Fe-4S ferredoxin n=1 Tax=Thiohalocapsa sp. TaxID=2497641 RepID=UPI0025F24DCF|nr:4Fe-4S ferredoxin [Thiohalocapsa sp.]MCG6941356.1 4Fe-4S ferredoxin [Thiohalocapsa sp.]
MGHLLSTKSSLVPLIDRLNRNPIGLVDNDKLREILSLLFDEREAYVASRFPVLEATRDELAKATGVPAAELDGILESLTNKGLVMELPYSGTSYYMLIPGLIGFFEITFMRRRVDLPVERIARLMTEYLNERATDGTDQAREFFGSRTQIARALVYPDQIPVTSRITPYEDAREVIRRASYRAVTLCYCRHKKEHLGQSCRKGAPVEGICMVLGEGARFLVRRGFAEERTVEQMLETLDYARSLGLTHVTDNVREQPTFLCNCCRCCCELLGGVQNGYPDGLAKTPFIAEVDPDLCDYCGECMRACNVKCIGLGSPTGAKAGDQVGTSSARQDRQQRKRWAEVQANVCLGCGVCIPTCEHGAITLKPRDGYRKPPAQPMSLYARMLWEKGRLWPYLREALKRRLRVPLMWRG